MLGRYPSRAVTISVDRRAFFVRLLFSFDIFEMLPTSSIMFVIRQLNKIHPESRDPIASDLSLSPFLSHKSNKYCNTMAILLRKSLLPILATLSTLANPSRAAFTTVAGNTRRALRSGSLHSNTNNFIISQNSLRLRPLSMSSTDVIPGRPTWQQVSKMLCIMVF